MNKALQRKGAHTGVMVALMVPADVGALLWQATLAAAMPSGTELLPTTEYHLTLGYFGDSAELDDTLRGALSQAVATFAAEYAPLTGVISGMGRFNADDGDLHPVYASFDCPELVAFRTALVEACAAAGAEPLSAHGFDPHITLAYMPADAETPDLRLDAIPVTFGAVTLAWGAMHSSFPLAGAKAAPPPEITPPAMPARPAVSRGVSPMEQREIKALPHHTKAITGRSVTGIFSVFGNIDSYADVMLPGSFGKTLRERGSKIIHLWQHDFFAPPIAVVDDIREIGRDALPEAVRAQYPEATGAMEVTRTYVTTPRADEVLTLLTAGVPLEMSFAFDPIKVEYGELNGRAVRFIREVKLYETSDVNWGANSATLAVRSAGLPLDVLALHLDRYLTAYKAGARHSTGDTKLINDIHAKIVDLGCTTCAGMLDEDGTAKGLSLVADQTTLLVRQTIAGELRTLLSAPLADVLPAPVPETQTTNDDDASRAADAALTRQRRLRLHEAALRLQALGS
jgi:HK97 family phage prohead protease